MQKPFNFKLLVPPRAHLNQISAVKPQETGLFEENSGFSPSNQRYNKCSDMETSLPIPSKMVLPTKTSRTDGMKKAAVMPMEKEETSLTSSQLYSRLLDEAEKIKMWKFKIDSEISQKDRKLQENRKTIETQRKAIQELQFANESLSMKLEDQLNENEDLRNKSNATRNLCNILKDTFERSAEKINLFEAEREETHDLFIQNSENIRRMVVAFESLRKQAESDQQDMLKLRECLTQFEDLKVKLESECLVKENEVAMLQEKLQEKENNLKDVSLKLKEAQQSCSVIEESERKHQKLLQSVTQDREGLEEKLRVTEQLKWEIEENQRALTYKLEQSKENHEKVLQAKDDELQELNNIKEQQANQLSEIQLTVNSLQSSLTSEIQRAQDLETKITSLVNELSDKNTELEVIKGQKENHSKQIQILRDELDEKTNSLWSIKEELKTKEGQILQLIASLEEKKSEANHLKDEIESVITENKNMKEALTKARHDNEELQKEVVLKAKLKEMEEQLSGALESSCKSSKEVERLERDIKQQKEKYEELILKFNDLQMQKDTIQQQVDSGALEKKVLQSHLMESNANAEREKTEIERLEREKQQLQEQVDNLSAKIAGQDEESKNVQQQLKESGKTAKRELLTKDKQIKALESKLTNIKTKIETKTKAHEECLKEITTLKEDLEGIKKHYKEELQKISSNLEDKSTSEDQLNLEVQKLKETAMEALKSKDDTEIKCQQKISDMVALMERHKHEYDKMLEEKDAELSEKRMREAEVNASKASLELELSHLQVEKDDLRQQLEKLKGEKVALRTPVSSLEKDTLQQVTEIKPKKGRNKISKTQRADTAKKPVYTLLKEDENVPPSRNASNTPAETVNEDLHTPLWSKTTKTTPQIKSFRIRTPPSPKIAWSWKENILKLDPKSDNSDSNDILSFSPRPIKSKKPMQPKDQDTGSLDMFKKSCANYVQVQSSFPCKSPGTVLKLAAIKRMRDAGWTTVSNSDKKKKKATDKIFA
ncbi:synaptonemal complex protein 1-like [Sinocyclocheilus rhinocerous]|uniref:synaptonemal complex protein 1-like n=1 Tax=Sinocyclocheilus rhinocerous TaxID=307959 RepID=UPI0007B88E42|nr:PREDICTED: synaptonemal complex protein 1-like [Sinocyclocheilus rhinocerous]